MDLYIDFNSINNIFYALFVFILALFSAWTWQLLPHKLVYLFDTDRRAQLITLFLLFAFSLQYFNPDHDIIQVLLHAIAMFFIYLCITKQSLYGFILTMVGFVGCALFSNNMKYLEKQLQTEESDNEKNVIQSKIDSNTKMRNGSIIFTLITIFVGISLYFLKQYKDHYNKSSNLLVFVSKFLFEGGSDQRKYVGHVISRV